jgi:DNA-directed RNA polymerase specialized sigma24 family protein
MPIFRDQPELLQAFRRGERHVLERVYRAHVRELDSYIRTLARAANCPDLAQPSWVADALQEVFVRAFAPAARTSFQADRPFLPYLRAIARHFFIDVLRSRGREVAGSEASLPESAVEGSYGESALDPRVSALLVTYVGSLAEPLKGVYEQRFVLGRSQEDACNALSLSRRKLRTAEARLKTGLRRALVHAGVPRGDLETSKRFSKPDSGPAALGRPHVAR